MKKALFVLFFLVNIFFLSIYAKAVDDYSEFRATAEALGFHVNNNYIPYRMLNDNFNVQERTYKIKDKLQYYTRVDDVLLKEKNTNIYALLYRVQTSPQDGRDWGILGIGSYGGQWLNHQVKVHITLPENCSLLNFVPKNNMSQINGSVGVGIDSNGAFSLSFNFDFSIKDLDVISNSNTYNRYYEAVYKFNHAGSYGLASNYLKGETFLYGIILFSSSVSPNPWLVHEISYYDCYASSINTIEVYGNYGIV